MKKLGYALIFLGAILTVFLIISTWLYNKYQLSEFQYFFILFSSLIGYLSGFVFVLLKTSIIEQKKIVRVIGIYSVIIFAIGFVYKQLHYPYAGLIISIGIILLTLIFAPLRFRLKFEKWKAFTRSARDAFILSLFDFIAVFIILFGVLFKLQHWPGAGVLAIGGLILVAISVFAWNQKFKKEVIFRKKAEEQLKENIEEIKQKKAEIEDKNEELHQQSEELKAQNEEIITQRNLLSEQNTSINESIAYAKRIQSAVMPPESYIDEIIPENFILFKPRNVVSGDFYWVKQVGHNIIIAVVDCTGHGVPGAFMSMLGISFLNEIVKNREITKASLILDSIRKQVKLALRQTGKGYSSQDGMDMALCILNLQRNRLQYAGANNPLYLFQKDEIIEIKADKMPIGYYPVEKANFSNHEVLLNPGDVFYMFSDGFQDQFGGEKGFKFRTKAFRELLKEIHKYPMPVQKEHLDTQLNNWMKGYEQTDDILVMGVRV